MSAPAASGRRASCTPTKSPLVSIAGDRARRRVAWRAGLALVVALASLLEHPAAHAQGARDPIGAEALFRQGRAAADEGDFQTACAKFAESQRLDPSAGT